MDKEIANAIDIYNDMYTTEEPEEEKQCLCPSGKPTIGNNLTNHVCSECGVILDDIY